MINDFCIQSNDVNLRGSSGGEGASVIMMHAGVADRRMWRATQEHFLQHYRTVSYDRRGFGETSARDEPFRHVDDLEAIIQFGGSQKQILIGCSQGGRIAIDYALMYPDNIRALVLVSTAITGAPTPPSYPLEVSEVLAELEKAEAKGDIELVNEIEARLWLDGPLGKIGRVAGSAREVFLDMNRIALNHPAFTQEVRCLSAMERMASIVAPTLVIWGDLDFPHIQERSAWIACTIPHAKSAVISRCAHLPSLEHPSEFNEIVGNFVATVS